MRVIEKQSLFTPRVGDGEFEPRRPDWILTQPEAGQEGVAAEGKELSRRRNGQITKKISRIPAEIIDRGVGTADNQPLANYALNDGNRTSIRTDSMVLWPSGSLQRN
jgi:hypothetical protein